MEKIKDKSSDNSFFGLRNKLFASPLERASLNLNIAKNIFIFSAFLYFFMFLMTVGGSFVDYSARITFFLYPVFVFSTIAFIYNLCSYAIVIYFEKYLFLRYIVLVLCGITFLSILSVYLGIYTFLLSLIGTK